MSLLNPQDGKVTSMLNTLPTAKQMKLINRMQKYGIYPFEGKTKQDAHDYISDNWDTFMEQQIFMD